MNTKQNLLEACTKSSKQHKKLMAQYKNFFNCLFTHPLQAFGYERWTTDDIYYGLSNLPAIAELFVETNAFEDQNVILEPKYMSSFCTFIYPDRTIHNHQYNDFRTSLEQHLQIRISFCIIKRQLNYCEAFVWNFKKPNMSLLEEKRTIISDFLKNSTLILACIAQFKKEITSLFHQTFGGINIRQQSPLYKISRNLAKEVGDYSQYFELSHYLKVLHRANLILSDDFCISPQEQKALELFLKTTDLEKNSSEILRNVILKLESLKYNEHFESEYHELQKMGLVR